jgi:hypothetical protein
MNWFWRAVARIISRWRGDEGSGPRQEAPGSNPQRGVELGPSGDEGAAYRDEAEIAAATKALAYDREHAHECHLRWVTRMNYPEGEWHFEQCGRCRFYIRLVGELRPDWGVCSNSQSTFDGQVRLEHDGCTGFLLAEDWIA